MSERQLASGKLAQASRQASPMRRHEKRVDQGWLRYAFRRAFTTRTTSSLVTGHDFSRAEKARFLFRAGFSPRHTSARKSRVPRAEARSSNLPGTSSARLKSCPVTKRSDEASLSEARNA